MRMAGEYDDDIMRIRDEDHRKREVHAAVHSSIAQCMEHVENHGTGIVAGLGLRPGSCPISNHFTVEAFGL